MIIRNTALMNIENITVFEERVKFQFSDTLNRTINTFRKTLSNEKDSEIAEKLINTIKCLEVIRHDFTSRI